MNDISENSTPKKGRPSIGIEAARRRDQLQRMNEAEERRKRAFREQREQLAKELAEVEVQERRARRLQEHKDQQRVCFLLGGLVLDAIRRQGPLNFAIGKSDLLRLKLDQQDLLTLVVHRSQPSSSNGEIDADHAEQQAEPGAEGAL